MKKTYKEQEQAQKRKNIIKWVFAGLGWTLLLGLFILLTTLGVRGCVDKNKRSAQESTMALNVQEKKPKLANQFDNYSYIYSCNYHEDTLVDSATMKLLATRVLGTNPGTSASQPDLEINAYYSSGVAYWQNGEFTQCTRARATLKSMDDYSGSLYYYRVVAFALFDEQDRVQYCYESMTYPYLANDTEVYFYENGSIVLSEDMAQEGTLLFDALLHPFYTEGYYHPYTLMFNEQINYHAFAGATTDMAYITSGVDEPALFHNDYYYGTFSSAGRIYDTIRVWYANASSMYFKLNGSSSPVMAGSGTYTFWYLDYYNSSTGVSSIVNRRDKEQYSINNGIAQVCLNKSTWTSQSFREITFLYGISEYDLSQVNRFNNNSSIINNGGGASGYISGIFDLLTNAFGTWASIFSIQLLPGMTIGLFIFMPLVVMTIVLVFKAVKK